MRRREDVCTEIQGFPGRETHERQEGKSGEGRLKIGESVPVTG